jgi:hypothetical protein
MLDTCELQPCDHKQNDDYLIADKNKKKSLKIKAWYKHQAPANVEINVGCSPIARVLASMDC